MADITNPEAIAYSDDYVRPICEKVRALKAEIDDAMTKWYEGINTATGSSVDDDLQDGRDAEGISRLTGDDITGAVTIFASLQTTLSASGVPARIQKPCVRPIKAE